MIYFSFDCLESYNAGAKRRSFFDKTLKELYYHIFCEVLWVNYREISPIIEFVLKRANLPDELFSKYVKKISKIAPNCNAYDSDLKCLEYVRKKGINVGLSDKDYYDIIRTYSPGEIKELIYFLDEDQYIKIPVLFDSNGCAYTTRWPYYKRMLQNILIPKYREGISSEYNTGANDMLKEVIKAIDNLDLQNLSEARILELVTEKLILK